MDFEEDPPQNSESDDDLVSLEDVDGLNKGQLKEQLIRALSRLVNADEQIEKKSCHDMARRPASLPC